MKKKIYVDMSNKSGLGFFIKESTDYEVVPAGINVSAISLSDKNEEYKYIEDNYNIYFIYEDVLLQIPFFTVPLVDVFAYDSENGYFVMMNEIIYYIDNNRKCYKVALNMNEFKNKFNIWKEQLQISEDIHVYISKEEALKELKFIE